MIDTNIITSLGAGSGIDTKNLVKQLVEIERAAPQLRIDSKRETTESKISDFGLVSSALSTLKDAAKILTEPTGLYSKTASFTDSNALVPTELDTDVQAGSYAFTVEQTAKAHTLAFEGFASPDEAVGEGDITFNFGTWTRNFDDGGDPPNGVDIPTFSQNADKDPVTITIDATNNSLEGLRDAINEKDMGVTASIVYDGSDYHLTILAESGEGNEVQMAVEEGGGDPVANNDGTGLSRFAFFNKTEVDFDATETQAGQDAVLTINGLSVSRSSNTIDDIVEGLHLDVLKADPGQTVTITVEDDKSYAEQNIRGFVEAYNLFFEAVQPAFGVSEVEDEEGNTSNVIGSLANDSLGKSVLTKIRSLISQAVPGLDSDGIASLTNIGIRTQLDGTLSIDEDDFSAAFDENYEAVQELFSPSTKTTDDEIYINSYNGSTQSGDYDIVITQPPAKGVYNGVGFGAGFSLDTNGKDYSFEVSVNGVTSGALSISDTVFGDKDAMALALQTAINGDSAIQDGGARVSVAYNSGTDSFDLTSAKYGDSSNVSFTAVGADFTSDLGLALGPGTAGKTVAGTINGVAGFGSANVLLPALSEPGAGMGMIIGENATSATVSFSKGFAGELETLIDELLGPSGVIAARENSLNDTLDGLDEDQEKLERRLGAFEERLIQQYINMERIISSLNSSGSFLSNLIDTLPFTASKD